MIITIKGADFSSANIGTLSTYIISKSIGGGAAFDIPNFVDKNSSVNWTITLDEGYTFGTYSVTMGGNVITPSVVDNVMTISIAEVTGNVRIVVATINENTGEEDGPVVPDEVLVSCGEIIQNPTNLRGGIVDFICVKPVFYNDILNKNIRKISVYKVADSSNAENHIISIGKVQLPSFDENLKLTELTTAYNNMSNVKTFDVSSYSNNTVMELDVDITLSSNEYLCFDIKNGHCVGFCNDSPGTVQMIHPSSTDNTVSVSSDRQVPISIKIKA